jgi:hypothetical protein
VNKDAQIKQLQKEAAILRLKIVEANLQKK